MKLQALMLGVAVLGWAGAATAQTVACNLDLNIVDQDAAGTNVRASPNGAVIKVLKARSRWVNVDVSGQSGAWARVTAARHLGGEGGQAELWKGVGWVAFSKLGIDHFDGPTRIRDAPNADAKVLLSIENPWDNMMLHADAVLGCDGEWLKVRVRGVVGWANNGCTSYGVNCTQQPSPG